MKRKTGKLVGILLVLLAPVFAYNLTVTSYVSSSSCPEGWFELARMSHQTNAHIAQKGYTGYTYRLCVNGEFLKDTGFDSKGSLENDESATIGMYKTSNSHGDDPAGSTTYAAYISCPVNASLKTSCGAEETSILEFYKSSNSHVAKPGTGETYKLCVKAVEPDIYEPACTCYSASATWGADEFYETLSNCCGDDPGEGSSQPLDGSCNLQAGETVCCSGNKCGRDLGGGSYDCVPSGSSCGSYLCSESTWWICEQTPAAYCSKVDENNDGYYDQFCDNTTGNWETVTDSADMCETACEQLNGIWTGQNDPGKDSKNCCSSGDTGVWCIATAERVTKCDNGNPTDCGVYCDTEATINDDGNGYDCSAASDRDCSSNSCSGSDCLCKKGEGTGCYVGSACESGSCITYGVATGEGVYFSAPSNPADTQNGGSFSGICCPANGCPYDSDGNGYIDKCAANGTANIDSDNDGDLDYCYQNNWKECASYGCSDANNCFCMSNSTGTGSCAFVTGTPGIYSTGTGACNIQNASLSCALPCDHDGNTSSREYINQQGACVRGGGSCLDVYKSATWFGNSSLSFVNVSMDCLCDSQARCTVNVYNDTDDLAFSTSQTIGAVGGEGLIPMSQPFDEGMNTIKVTCGCGSAGTVPPTGCERTVASLNYMASSSFGAGNWKVGSAAQLNVLVNNLGDIDLSQFTVGVNVNNGAVSLTNISSEPPLGAGNSRSVPIKLSIPISMFNDTKQSLSNQTELLVFTNVTDVLILYELSGNSYAYQCDSASDCPTACPSPAGNCWAFGAESNFSCSLGVCCPSGQHFEDGACCLPGYRCCVSDGSCSSAEWCANASAYSDYGIVWSCNDLRLNGQTCGESRMCDSGNCEADGVGGGNDYCCPAVMTIGEAGGECSTTQGGDVCASTGCCTEDAECAAGAWCSLYGSRCVDCPDATSSGYFNGYCASTNCVGTDADCCNGDADCATAESLASSSYFCNLDTSTCESCTTELDYYCPSFAKCYAAGPENGDPDCCASDADCLGGSTCVDNTCVPENIGKYCSSDADCGQGLSCINNGCVLNDFVVVNPNSIDMNVGEIRYANIIVRDPQLKQDAYTLSLSGKYLQFAKIDDRTSMQIVLGPNEVKKFTMVIYGGAAVSNTQIKVFASSESTPGIASEEPLTVNIAQTSGAGLVAAASGITVEESLAVLVIGGVLVWSLKRL